MKLSHLISAFMEAWQRYGDLEVRAGTPDETYPVVGSLPTSGDRPPEPEVYFLLVLDDEEEAPDPPPAAVVTPKCHQCNDTHRVFIDVGPLNPGGSPVTCPYCDPLAKASKIHSRASSSRGNQ